MVGKEKFIPSLASHQFIAALVVDKGPVSLPVSRPEVLPAGAPGTAKWSAGWSLEGC